MRNSAAALLGGACIAAGAWLLGQDLLGRLGSGAWQAKHAGLFRQDGDILPAGRPAGTDGSGPSRTGGAARPPTARYRRGEAVARLRLPRLGLDSVIAEGTDPGTLAAGPGHMEGSALPGVPDNCIIAGHRDGPFARLRSLATGDTVELIGADGTWRYRIVAIRIVPKEDVSVLAPSDRPILTLITCYPFEYVGHAPKRLIAVGELLPAGAPA